MWCYSISIPHPLSPLFPSPFPLSPDNGLPSSFSTDVLLTPEGYQRPLSIFSVRPSVSVDTSLTTSEGWEATKGPAESPLSPDVREKKIIMGIGHFNRLVCGVIWSDRGHWGSALISGVARLSNLGGKIKGFYCRVRGFVSKFTSIANVSHILCLPVMLWLCGTEMAISTCM